MCWLLQPCSKLVAVCDLQESDVVNTWRGSDSFPVLMLAFVVVTLLCADAGHTALPMVTRSHFPVLLLITLPFTEHIRLKLKQHDLLRIYPNLEVGKGGCIFSSTACFYLIYQTMR
jgi:hypothetical protein